MVFTDRAVHPMTLVRESELNDLAADAVKEALNSTSRPGDVPVGPWSVRLQITTVERMSYEIQRSEYCPPTLDESAVVSRVVSQEVSEAELDRLLQEVREAQDRSRRMRQYRAKCLITSDGAVGLIEVLRSSGNSDDDRTLERMLRRASFRPATLDGVPVPGWWVGRPFDPRAP
jgi:TonB family protein